MLTSEAFVAVEEQIARVAGKVKAVRRRRLNPFRRGRLNPFGTEGHKFRALPPMSADAVAVFEQRHRLTLPADYRAFITTISSGGTGPAYGLVPFAEVATYRGLPEDIVSRPFPFTVATNPYNDPTLADFWHREGRGQLQPGEYETEQATWVSGTLVLCHEGCGHLHLLVVSGPAYGTMWVDSTVSDGGYIPLGFGFLDWYEWWLDNVLSGGRGTWWLRAGVAQV